MNMHVVDVTHTEPWIINTYVIHIYREGLAEKSNGLDNVESLKACYLSQVKLCSSFVGDHLYCGDTCSLEYDMFRGNAFLLQNHHFLFQSCELKLVPANSCGIQPSKNYSSWSQFIEARKILPNCSTGDASGNIFGCIHCVHKF